MPTSVIHTPNMSTDSDDDALASPQVIDSNASCWVTEPTCNDVLCGRGGSINGHPGNEFYRALVEKRRRVYLTARFKREKRLIASSIVSEIRGLNPSGRFLTRDTKSGRWRDIGDEKARDKTSQALRENAPTIRAEIETEINEHHAEMQRAEEEGTHVSQHAPPPYPAYSAPGWGYPAFYGHPHAYGHGPPPPPPPYHGFWGAPPPHYPPHPSPYTQATSSTPYPPSPPKSALEQTVDLVASSADSIKQWTQKSLSFGGMLQPTNSSDGASRADTNGSKPIVYVHDDGTKKRRMVKFREDQSFSSASRRRPTKRHNANASLNGNSLVNGEYDYEPHDLEATAAAADGSPTGLMNSFANNFLSSIGSWDAVSIMCGQDQSDDRKFFPRGHDDDVDEHDGMEHVPDEDMVEWEGQEVQLMDNRIGSGSDSCRESTPDRMPPPPRRHGFDQASSVGFSSLGSCHSWLPDQISATASYFQGSRGEGDSMDLDSAGGTENFSAAGSVGGGSLTKVFEHETLDDGLRSPQMTLQALQTMPSWERHIRSRSPSSVGGDDDESLISRTSSKLSDHGGGGGLSIFPVGSASSMNWESRE
ncbi:hypothetical protein MPSEU_000456200 [Mayamaea pseudoterrestris]|nr:hypothetical protein MPSEU_000456200 [Mayamaea pseudoterrestris]